MEQHRTKLTNLVKTLKKEAYEEGYYEGYYEGYKAARRVNKAGKMNTKQWDKDIEEGIKHKTVLDLINEYWDKRSLEIWGETEEVYKEMEKEKND